MGYAETSSPYVGIVRDSAEALEEVMMRAISTCNVVVTSGGVSSC